MRILMTGGAGFIGYHLAKKLASNPSNQIVIVDNLLPSYGGDMSSLRANKLKQEAGSISLIENDLRKIGTLDDPLLTNIDVVIHLAAWPGVSQGQIHPNKYFENNINGFGAILDFIKRLKPKKFFFASSSSIYGDTAISGPVNEDAATGKNLKSFYAATKWSNEILASAHAEITGITTIALRFFTVFGTFGRPDMAYWKFSEALANNETIDLYNFNGGVRNFTPVDDVVIRIEALLEKGSTDFPGLFNAINVAAGAPIETRHMLEILKSQFENYKQDFNIVPRPNVDVEKTWADCSKLESMIGHYKEPELETEFIKFVSWFKSFRQLNA